MIQNGYQRITSLYGNYEMAVDPESVLLGNDERLVDVCRRVFGCPPKKVYRLGKSDFGERSFKVLCDGKWLKCYECLTVAQAQMIRDAVEVVQKSDIPIPPILGHDNHVLFAQWIDGVQMGKYSSKKCFDQLLAYQLALHGCRLDDRCAPYERPVYFDLALEMIRMYAPPSLTKEVQGKVFNSLTQKIPRGLTKHILHADYKKGNLILTKDGRMVVIDNETLGIGYGNAVDVIYTARMLFRRDPDYRDRYIREYVEKSGDRSIFDHWDFWELCFLARRIANDFKGHCYEDGLKKWQELSEKAAK
jgi:hypothetical protein